MTGKLILIVGPSGVGKDTLIDGARRELGSDARLHFARRTITRAEDAGGEDHEEVSEAEFARRQAAGQFFAHWRAHGLGYGVSVDIEARLQAGQTVILNGSRSEITTIAQRWPWLGVIVVDAPPNLIAARLLTRGRESGAALVERHTRPAPPPVIGVHYETVMNAGTIAEGVAALVASIRGMAAIE